MKNKKIKKIIPIALLALIMLITSVFFIKQHFFKEKKEPESLINIATLSEEFVNNYFEEYREIEEEDKENLLIVISKEKIKETYGATKVIEAPNNQYILQYASAIEKNNALTKLSEDKSIISAEENKYWTIEATTYNSWGIEKMSLDSALEDIKDYNLKDVTVAVIDTGVDVALANKYYDGKISEMYNVLEDSTTIMTDENGHGTHVLGTIAEATPDNVKIIPIKITSDGRMTEADVLAAINYVTYYEKADVMNMSFGGFVNMAAVGYALEAANQKNIISVACAGNQNQSSIHYPSAFDNTISVGSIDSSLNKSTFSNYGSHLDFVAPGTAVKSIMSSEASIAQKNGNKDGDPDHELMNGTSMATPHITSSIAILKSFNKDLSLKNVRELLQSRTIDLGADGWDIYYGYGFVSFENAEFCDGVDCDEYNVFKNAAAPEIEITSIEPENADIYYSNYNYGNITNLMNIKIKINYSNGTSFSKKVSDLENATIENYDPNILYNESTQTGIQTVTIKYAGYSTNVQVANKGTETAWIYEIIGENIIKITGINSNVNSILAGIIYVPETIDGYTVKEIGDAVFKGKTNLRKVILPSTVEKIGKESFMDNISLETVVLPEGLKYIDKYAFKNSNLTHIELPETLETIIERAFENTTISKIHIPASVTTINRYTFAGCNNLQEITVDPNNPKYDSRDNSNAIIETYTNKMIKGTYTTIIPDTVTIIGEGAFYNDSRIERITIPDNITTIEYDAFGYDDTIIHRLKEIIIPRSVTSLYLPQKEDLTVYTYEDAYAKEFAEMYQIPYIIMGYNHVSATLENNQYKAFDTVTGDITVVANYEAGYYDEYYDFITDEYATITIYSGDVKDMGTEGISLKYIDNRDSFRYGDEYITIKGKDIFESEFETNSEVEVTKAIPNYTIPTNLKGKDGNKISSLQLPEGFEWMNPDEIIDSDTDLTYKARFTPTDTTNYEIIENIEITILTDVIKEIIEPEITINDKTYDGTTTIPLELITISGLDPSEYTIENIVTNNSDIGQATATITLKLTSEKFKNFIFSNRKQAKEFTIEYQIVPLKLAKPTPIDKTYIYTGVEQTLELNNYHEDKMDITGNKRTKAGEQEVVISLKNSNYVWTDGSTENVTLNFKINQAKLEKPTLTDKTYTYSGKEQTVELNNFDNEKMSITGNKRRNAGEYEVVITLANDNYIWSDDTTTEVTLIFVINQEKIEKPTIKGDNYTYNGDEQTAQLNNFVESIMSVKGNTRTNAGEQDLTVSLTNSNYLWSDGTNEDVILKFIIKPAKLEKPSLKETILTYNGDEQIVELYNFDEDIMSVTGNSGTNVGKYEVTVSITNKNFVWSDNTKDDVILTFEIIPNTLKKPTLKDITYTYTGAEQTAQLFNYLDDKMSVSGNKRTNAGEQNVVVKLTDKNYTWTDGTTDDVTLKFVINPAKIKKPTAKEITYVYTGDEQTIELNDFDESLMNIEGNKQTEVGEHDVIVSLKTSNYIWSDGTSEDVIIKFVIQSIKIEKPTLKDRIYLYTGEEQTVELNNFDSTKMTITGNKQTDVGEYTVTISLKGGNYVWSDNTTDDVTLKFVINPAKLNMPSLKETELLYTGEEQTVEVLNFNANIMKATGNKGTEIGKYDVIISLTNKNYVWSDNTNKDLVLSFTINPIKVKKPTLKEKSYIYNGKEQTVEINDYYEAIMNITGNKRTEVGSQDVIISLDNINYVWEDGTRDDVRLQFIIGVGQLEKPTLKDVVYTYTGEEQTVLLNNYDESSMSIKGNKRTEAGTQDVIISLKDPNYVWNDGTNKDVVLQFTIKPVKLEKPTLTDKTYTYNGKEQTAEINNFFEDKMTISGNKQTEAGEYDIVISLKNTNYIWSDDTRTNVILKFIINPVKFEKPTLVDKIYTYTGEEQTVELNNFDEESMSITGNKQTEVGEYEVVISLNNPNYAWNDGTKENVILNFIIYPVELKKPTLKDVVYTYTGEEQTVELNDYYPPIMNISGNKQTDSGEYDVIISLKNENYVWTDGTKETVKLKFVIKPAKLEIPTLKEETITYNGEEQTIELDNYNEEIMEITGNKGTDVGTYKVIVSLTNKNYIWNDDTTEDKVLNFTIEPAKLKKPTLKETELIYTGEEQTVIPQNYREDIMNITGNKATEAGTYEAIVSLTNKNYVWADETTDNVILKYIIKPLVLEKPTLKETELTYNGKKQTVELNNFREDVMTVTGNSGTDVGTYEVIVSLTNKNYVWSDNTNDDLKLSFTIKPLKLEKPTLKETELIYNGSEQTVVIINYNEQAMNVTGNKATDVGTYEVIISLKNQNYVWDDDTTDDIILGYRIKPLVLEKPTMIEKTYIYNGEEQTFELNNYLEDKMNIKGNKRTDAGTQEVVVSLNNPNYEWSDGTKDDIKFTFTINPVKLEKPTLKESKLPYTGEEQIVEILNLKEDVMTVTGNRATNVGQYKAIVTLTNKNYVWKDDTTDDVILNYTIEPLVLEKPTMVEKTYTYNGTEQILELENYLEERMDITGNIQTVVGDHEVVISLSNPNYIWSDGTKDDIKFTFTINPVKLEKPTLKESTLPYTGEEQTVEILNFQENLMSVTGNKATNEGQYEAIVSLTNPNYVWSDGTKDDVVLSYTIAPLVLKKPTLVDRTYTYNGEEQILELENFLEERMNITGNIQTEAGKHEVIISLKNPNYTWEDGTKDDIKFIFEIIPEKLEKPTLKESILPYTGEEQTVEIINYLENLMTVTGNSATEVGTYEAIVTLTNPNYVWKDGTREDVILSYKIEPLILKKPTLVDRTYTYNGEEQILELENFLEERMNITGNVQTEAGKHEVIISLNNPNYIWEDGTKDNIKFIFEIEPIKIEKPTLKETELTYNGTEQIVELNNYVPGVMNVTGNKGTEIGKYDVIVTLTNPNYVWSDGTRDNILLNFTINPIKLEKPTLKESILPYTGEEQTVEILNYLEDIMDVTGNSATNEGTYNAIVTLTNPNYVWSDGTSEDVVLSYTIAPLVLKKPTLVDKTYTYNGEVQILELENYLEERMNITGNIQTEAGKYEVIISLDNPNYTWEDGTKEDIKFIFEINQAILEKPTLKETILPYTGEEQTVEILNYLEDIMDVTGNKGTDVGTYEAIVTLTNPNYVWSDGTREDVVLSYTIAPLVLKKPTLVDKTYTYNGEVQILELENYLEERMNITGNIQTEAGKHEVIISLNNSNYAWEDGTKDDINFIFEIIPVILEKPTLKESILDYTGEEQTVEILNFQEGVMTVTGNSATEVGTYEATVSLTNPNYVWSDGTREDIVLSYSIQSLLLEKPTMVDKVYIYNALEQKLELENYLEDKMNITGNIQTEAGEYEVIVSLENPNYTWSDGTKTDLSFNFIINHVKLEKPTLKENTLSYTGEEQTVEINNYIDDIMIVTGNSATEVGVYNAIVSLINSNYVWSDGTREDVALSYNIEPQKLEKPTLKENTLSYTGEEQTIELINYNEDIMSVTGNKATDVGEYDLIISLTNPNYVWNDGTREDVVLRYSIKQLVLEKPTMVEKTYTYNGSEQLFELSNYFEDKMNITGNKRTDAGEQEVVVSLQNSNYIWSDGTNNDVRFTFKINQLKIEKPTPVDKTYVYTGEEQIIELNNYQNDKMIITGNKRTNAGTQDVVISLVNTNYIWEDSSTNSVVLQFTIEKAIPNIIYTTSGQTVLYDGNEHGINLNIESPNNVVVKYMDKNGEYTLDEMPKYIKAGNYPINFKLSIDENYTEIFDGSTLIITTSAIQNNTTDFETIYDGNEHTLNLDISLDSYIIKFSVNNYDYNLTELPKFKEVGEYTINYVISANGYEDLYGSNKVKIYGIKEFDESIKKNENLLILDDNNFSNLINKINIYSITSAFKHLDNAKKIIATDIIKTGDYLNIKINNSHTIEYLLVYRGDVTADGKISYLDYVSVYNHIQKIKDPSSTKQELKELALIAADMSDDGKINYLDYVKIYNKIKELKGEK